MTSKGSKIAVIAALERQIKSGYPEITGVFIEAQTMQAHRRDVRASAERAATP
jgi:hypothetical protein